MLIVVLGFRAFNYKTEDLEERGLFKKKKKRLGGREAFPFLPGTETCLLCPLNANS